MIEMHQEGEPLGDNDGAYPAYQGSRTRWTRLAFSAPAMAIASLLLSLAVLTTIQAGVELGETRAFSHSGSSNLTILRWSTAVRLGFGVIGLVLAVLAAVQVHDDEDLGADDEDLALPGDPLWVRALTGAALLLSIGAVVVGAAAFIYAATAHTANGVSF